jgi:hypothetical protein
MRVNAKYLKVFSSLMEDVLAERMCYMCGHSARIKKKTKIFLIYKEIQMELGAKSYMSKGFLIYEEMRKYFL